MRQARLLIDGTWQDAVAGKTFDSVNPATGEIIAQVAEGDKQDIDLAVRAARRAYDGPWSAVDPADRGRLLLKLADLVEAHGDELAMLDTLDAGRPLADCKADVRGAAAVIRFAAGLPDKIYGHTIPMPRGYMAYTRREPYGVVGGNHAVELSVPDGVCQDRSHPGDGQHLRSQAGRAGAVIGARGRATGARGRLAGRRCERGYRDGCDGGRRIGPSIGEWTRSALPGAHRWAA